MAVAGKVAITLSTENGGVWSANVTYDRLVAVKHNNNLYISRKTVTNVEPPNNEFWFLALEGYSGEDVQALIDRMNAIITGTQQVGNAKTLDGHGAEYFQTVEGETLGTSILEKALSYTKDGIYNYRLLGGNYTGTDLPNNDYKNGQATVITRVAYGNKYGTTVILWGANNSSYVQRIAVNYYASSGWTGWREMFTTDGGTITTNSSNHLPQLPLDLVNGVNENGSVIRFTDQKGVLGHLGFTEKNKPIFSDVNGTVKDLLHTGNKPTGTYTGNGSATVRAIATGGIGNFICVRRANQSIAFVTQEGYFAKQSGSVLVGTDAWVQDGTLSVKTTSALFNESGVTYTYEVH